MAATKTLTGKVTQIQRDIQAYLDLFYEINSLEVNQAGEVSSIMTLSDTPSSTAKTIKIFKGKKSFVETTIQTYIALGYKLLKHQEVKGEFFLAMLLNGAPEVYKALISQVGIVAPTATVQQNTLNEIPTYNRLAAAQYTLTITSGKFIEGKTLIFTGSTGDDPSDVSYTIGAKISDVNTIMFQTRNSGALSMDEGVLDNIPILIEIYP
jgi:hypothetical protein